MLHFHRHRQGRHLRPDQRFELRCRHFARIHFRMICEDAHILSTDRAYEGAFITWFHAPGLSANVTPGQIVMLHCSVEHHDPMFARAFSYYRLDGDRFALLYNVVGRGTAWLARQPRGTAVS